MRRGIAVLLLILLALTGCTSTPSSGVQPGDGPAAAEEPSGPVEGEPSDEPTEDTGPAAASFKEKITYPDGLEVEVIRTRVAKFGEYDSTDGGDAKKGDPYILLSVRVKNGSKKTVQLVGSGTVSYGPDGEEASTAYTSATEGMDGKLIPGKSKTGKYGYVVPAKYRSDVTFEFSPDFEHESAVFTGSLS